MGTLSANKMATTYLNLVFQKTDNKMYYTNGSDVDTEITTFASGITFTTAITASAGIILGNNTLYNSDGEASLNTDADQGISLGASKILHVDNIVEMTSANGVRIESVTVKDGTITLGGNVIKDSDGAATITLDTSSNVSILGDLTVIGNDIKSSSATAMTMSGANVALLGTLSVVGTSSGTMTLGASADGTDRSIKFGHTTNPCIMGIDDSADVFAIHTGSSFASTNDFVIAGSGAITTGGTLTTGGNIIIPNAGNIGSASDTNAIAISADGVVTLTQNIVVSGAGLNTITGPTTCNGKVLLAGNTGPANGAGIDSDGSRHHSWIEKIGGVIKTSIYVDLDGVAAVAVDKATIGLAAGGASYLGLITEALNGAIFAVKMTCLEVPTVGSANIDLYNAAEANYGYGDNLVSISSTEYFIIDGGGNWTNGMVKGGTTITFDATSEYLYLVNGAGSGAGEYATGKFLIELWGA